MEALNQSDFLQALGWATISSLWQMAFIWGLYLLANQVRLLTPERKYVLSVAALFGGFALFIGTFVLYLQNGSTPLFSLLEGDQSRSDRVLTFLLTSASVAYLTLLIVPAYRLFRNWRYVQFIKKNGLSKPPVSTRLFVQKVAASLNIRRNVQVYVSGWVQSPLTVGYLKPMILLPVAALNNLSVAQAEAILLHELSHIKRSDYLVNFLLSVIHTLLYFNPFIRLFIKEVETEREKCCDGLVLQFEYDRIGYASALVTLEKAAGREAVLAMGAAGKKYLLDRIQRIVGMESKKPAFSVSHLAGICTVFILVLLFHSFVQTRRSLAGNEGWAFNEFPSPFALSYEPGDASQLRKEKAGQAVSYLAVTEPDQSPQPLEEAPIDPGTDWMESPVDLEPEPGPAEFVQVAELTSAADARLSAEEQAQVKDAVENTRKMVKSQWTQVEESIADGLTSSEKKLAHQEYLREVEKIDWKNLEQNLKAAYEEINWEQVNSQIRAALIQVKLDSLQHSYSRILTQLDKAGEEAACQGTLLFPDASVQEIQIQKEAVRSSLNAVKGLKKQKVVKL
ncbi:MAG TPA: M56 family metallopeptidase [Chitinophagaceae bacterium]|nr:M56 family metallopeptidase [Chitinophagaceae bacterium]